MPSELWFSTLLICLALVGWHGFPRRVDQDVAQGEITRQAGHRYIFMYRGWSVGFTIVGVVLAILTLAGQ